MNDNSGVADEFNRMIDSFATLFNQQTSTARSIQTMAESLQQTAMWLTSMPQNYPDLTPLIQAATRRNPTAFSLVPPSEAGAGNASTIVSWWPEDQERPQPRRHWLGRRMVIRAIWEVDQYLMNNIGRFVSRIIAQVDQYLTDNPLRFINGILRTVDTYLMDNLPRYVASIMVEVNKNLGLIIQTHLVPYVDWLVQLLESGISWLGQLFNAGIQWFESAVQGSIVFMGEVIQYLYHTTVKALIRDLLDTVVYPFMGRAIANLYTAIIEPLVNDLLFGSVYPFLEIAIHNLYLSTLRPLMHDLLYTVVYPFLLWAIPGLRAVNQLRDWIWNQPALGPTPLQPITTPAFPGLVVPPYGPNPWPPPLPTINLPPFQQPTFTVPPPPQPQPVTQILAPVGGIAPLGTTPTGTVTLNGDINVSIATTSVDSDHADDVGRQIASRVLEELQRLAEIERFSRGLPANGTP